MLWEISLLVRWVGGSFVVFERSFGPSTFFLFLLIVRFLRADFPLGLEGPLVQTKRSHICGEAVLIGVCVVALRENVILI